MGARLATRAAGLRPDVVAAVGGFHGGGLVVDGPDSPHLMLAKARAEFVYGHADGDHSMPVEAVEPLGAALEAAGLRHTNEIYAGPTTATPWPTPRRTTRRRPSGTSRRCGASSNAPSEMVPHGGMAVGARGYLPATGPDGVVTNGGGIDSRARPSSARVDLGRPLQTSRSLLRWSPGRWRWL